MKRNLENNSIERDASAAADAPVDHLTRRRQALLGILGLGAGMFGGALPLFAASADSGTSTAATEGKFRRMDVHAHYLPEEYRTALAAAGHSKPSGMPGIPKWSVEQAVAMMDRMEIQAAVISVSAPGVYFGDANAAQKLARYVNEEGAKAVSAHPKRFGFFASLPLPDIDASLREIERAFDTLHADGIVLCTNHGGIYLGDARFDPVFAELNRRNAKIFIHPNDPQCPCCKDGKDGKSLPPIGYPYPMIEFMFETTRAIFNLILSGSLDRYANLKIIVPHAGATIPVLADRVTGLSPALGLAKPLDTDHVFELLRRLYFDLAGFPLPRQLPALLQVADPKHIMYGSDWPFTPDPLVANLAKKIDATNLITPEMRRDFLRENALELFPRFKSA